MFDLVNGKTILCKARTLMQDELDNLNIEEGVALMMINPRMLNLMPVPGSAGSVQIALIPYLGGKEVILYTHHIVGESTTPRVYNDQYIKDTTGILTAQSLPDRH